MAILLSDSVIQFLLNLPNQSPLNRPNQFLLNRDSPDQP